jgi:hypothetical protein
MTYILLVINSVKHPCTNIKFKYLVVVGTIFTQKEMFSSLKSERKTFSLKQERNLTTLSKDIEHFNPYCDDDRRTLRKILSGWLLQSTNRTNITKVAEIYAMRTRNNREISLFADKLAALLKIEFTNARPLGQDCQSCGDIIPEGNYKCESCSSCNEVYILPYESSTSNRTKVIREMIDRIQGLLVPGNLTLICNKIDTWCDKNRPQLHRCAIGHNSLTLSGRREGTSVNLMREIFSEIGMNKSYNMVHTLCIYYWNWKPLDLTRKEAYIVEMWANVKLFCARKSLNPSNEQILRWILLDRNILDDADWFWTPVSDSSISKTTKLYNILSAEMGRK